MIKKIGVELEGGWARMPNTNDSNAGDVHNDGSVNGSLGDWTGEIISKPLTDIVELQKWVLKHYPDAVDSSCGFHVHISTQNFMEYTILMEQEFNHYFLKEWKRWGDMYNIKSQYFWNRLEGRSAGRSGMNYCQKKFIPKDQYSRTKGSYDRYTQLNFTWTVHGTLEMRSLCMFKDKLLSSAALKFWYDTVNRYLEIKSRRNPIIESKFIINKAEMEPAVFEI